MTLRVACAFASASLLIAASAGAQAQPRYTQVYSSDSMQLAGPTLSPNGRWIAFSAEAPDDGSMQIVVVGASGGKSIAITRRGAKDFMPVWLPTSDGLVFRSTRADGALMSVHIDPQTAEPKNDLRRVTIEPVQGGMTYAVSPDGKEIAYATARAKGHAYIKVVPMIGGTARTLAEYTALIAQLYWPSPESVEYALHNRETMDLTVMRVPARGGTPEVVRHYDQTKGFAIESPKFALRGSVVRINLDTLGRVSVVSHAGDTLTHFDSKQSWFAGGLNQRLRVSNDGEAVTMSVTHPRTAVRIASISAEGAPKVLRATSDSTYVDEPVGFSADSRSVYLINRHQPVPRLELAPIAGGQSRFWTLPQGVSNVRPTIGGRFAYVTQGHLRDSARTLQLMDLQTGKLEPISTRVRAQRVRARFDQGDIFFAEGNGSRLDIRHFTPGTGNAVVASIDTTRLNPNGSSTLFNEHGVVYQRFSSDSVWIFGQRGEASHLIARMAGFVNAMALSPDGHRLAFFGKRIEAGKPRVFAQLVSLDENFAPQGVPKDILGAPAYFDEITWSPDGRTLGVGYGAVVRSDTVLTWSFVTPDGTVGRTVQIPHPSLYSEWSTSWAKDGKHVYVLTTSDPETKMQLWRIADAADEQPRNILSRETNHVWEFVLAPDEKSVLYNPEVGAHNVIWRIDLGGVVGAKP